MIKLDRIIEITKESNRRIQDPEVEATVNTQEDASVRSPGVEAHYYRFFHFLVKEMKPKRMIELGTHTGISSLCLYEGNPDARIITLDHHERVMPQCFRDGIEYVVQDSYQRIELDNIDLLFIDTDHDGVRPRKEYELYEPFMAENSLIFFDDVNLTPSMREFWKSFKPARGTKVDLPVHGDAGFGMIYINSEKGGE